MLKQLRLINNTVQCELVTKDTYRKRVYALNTASMILNINFNSIKLVVFKTSFWSKNIKC